MTISQLTRYDDSAITRLIPRAAVGMGIPMGIPMGWVWDGHGDYDESPWVCGDSMGIFEWILNYVETS